MIKRKRGILEVIPMTIFYMCRMFGSPLIILCGLIGLCAAETIPGLVLILLGLSPHILAYALARSSRKKIRKILSAIKSSESFLPEPKYEFWEPHSEAYLGIDAKRGTFVYVRLIRRGQVDLIGFDMHNWVGIELDGRLLNIKTKTIEAPVLSMGTRAGDGDRILSLINTMSNRQYRYDCYYFPGYIAHNAKRIAEEHKVFIPVYN
ncbi:plasmid IncI1-type surface exclusion protein ExcA [Klebsiella quasipneumoniae]|uniref:plasmid IncI1-type surface exclusion protein ExcA n=1 Tax=Klebsiella quasipneumoniae TaxID=1463165 RepID=UPI0010350D45|nr:plasmid IncI1-type surface exclusion protein ExcA [Klebsiella quasipneumoniae]